MFGYLAHRPSAVRITAVLILVGAFAGVLGIGSPETAHALTFTVNTDNDVDDGTCDVVHCSLREAINAANAAVGADLINFTAPLTIKPLFPLPVITDRVTIDGTAAPPTIDGSTMVVGGDGLSIAESTTLRRAYIINISGGAGIRISGGFGTSISSTTIGADAANVAGPMGGHGVHMTGGNAFIESSVIVNSAFVGVMIDAGATGAVRFNRIGFIHPGLPGPNFVGIVSASLGPVTIQGNSIGFNSSNGITLGASSASHVLEGNVVGMSGTPTPNGGDGALIGGTGHKIGPGLNHFSSNMGNGLRLTGSNIFVNGVIAAFNSLNGILSEGGATLTGEKGMLHVEGNAMSGILVQNSTTTIRRATSIFSNTGLGIRLDPGANGGIAAPVVTSVTSTSVSGIACVDCEVDVYTDAADEGRTYFGTVVADGAGGWTFPAPAGGPNVTATATDAAGNTSEFSVPVAGHCSGPVCITGLHEATYLNFGGVVNHCTASVIQDNDGEDPGEIHGDIDCTTAHDRTLTGTFKQATRQVNVLITDADPLTTDFVSSGTFDPTGTSAVGTWDCVPSCGGPFSWSSKRVAAMNAERISAGTGGTLETALGDTLAIPAGSLAADTNIQVEMVPIGELPPSPTVPILSRAFRAEPAGTTFTPPATAVIRYTTQDIAAGLNPADLRVMVWNSTLGIWQLVGGTVDTFNMTITVQIPHFSLFGVMDCGSVDLDASGNPAWEWIADGAPEGEHSGAADCDQNDDNDRCLDKVEPGLVPPRNPDDPWDFADMWTPSLPASGTPSGGRNGTISLTDVLATLDWVGANKGGPPNASGRQYDNDVNVNGVPDGREYDRTPTMLAGVSGPPNSSVTLQDVLVVLSQSGQSC